MSTVKQGSQSYFPRHQTVKGDHKGLPDENGSSVVVSLAARRRPAQLAGRLVGASNYPQESIERLFEDPRAEGVARWIAQKTVAVLVEPNVLDPVLKVIVEKVTAEPIVDVDTIRTPGDFYYFPIKTKSLHNVANYETFEDLFELPTGGSIENEDGPSVETFLDLTANLCRFVIIQTLKSETQKALTEAPDDLRHLLIELERHGELDEFAETIIHDLAIIEQYDEFDLVNGIARLPFPLSLLACQPNQADRLQKDRAVSHRKRHALWQQQKATQAIATILRAFLLQPSGYLVSGVDLLHQILRAVLDVEESCAADEAESFDLLRQLAREDRLLALLSKREKRLFERQVTHWIHQAEQGPKDFAHPLVKLYHDLDRGYDIAQKNLTLTVRQGNNKSDFDAANWPFFLAYALCAGDPRLGDKFEIVASRLRKPEESETTSLIQSMAGIVIDGEDVDYLTADAFRQMHGADLQTGSKSAVLGIVDADHIFHEPIGCRWSYW
jgi:hypothetical protein